MKIIDALKSHSNGNEARILLSYVTGKSQEYLIRNSEEILVSEIVEKYYQVIRRRCQNEPIAYILGYKEFYGRDFIVNNSVLIPRCDSEILIDAVLTSGCGTNILELGVGSGCLILTLLLERPDFFGSGVDISTAALSVAEANMQKYDLANRCNFIISDWFQNITGKYDIIVANPPYIARNDQALMAKETLLFEPEKALYADNNGFGAYESIAQNIGNFLSQDGIIYLEIGINQQNEVARIFSEYGYRVADQHNDLAGIVRVLSLRIK